MSNTSRIVALTAGIFLFAANGASAQAATATANFTVTASVASACSVSATNLAFGSYNPLSATPTSATSTVQVTCTLGTPYTVGLNAGTGTGATVTTRKMTSGANTLNYALYRDVANTLNWGNTAGTDTAAGVGTGLASNLTVYGVIAALQSVQTGSYLDTITVTVTY